MTRPAPKADPARALQALRTGQSAFPGYAVCQRTDKRWDSGTILRIVQDGLTWRQAIDACDPLPADHLVCLMADYR